MNVMRLGMVSVLCLSLNCCHILDSGKPARQVYLLQTPSPPSHNESAKAAPTLIISVTAVPGLDTDRILVLGRDARLSPVSNAHWPDHMPEVLTSITRRYLSDSHQFRMVRQGSIARPDEWLLELELQAFYGIQGAAESTSSVLMQMEGDMRCDSIRQVLRISEQSPVNGDTLSDLVAAHQRVIDASMRELSSEITSTCAHPATD